MKLQKYQIELSFIVLFFLKISIVEAKEISLGVNSFPSKSINIFSRSTNQTQVLRQIYEPLFTIDQKSKLNSPYFSKWKVNSQGTIYEFELKNDLRFSDGKMIDSKQIASIFTRTNPNGGKILGNVKKVDCKGNIIRLELEKGSYLLPEKLSDLSFSILSDKLEFDFPVGTGAFKIVKWEKNNILLERNIFHRDFKIGNVDKINVKLLERNTYDLNEVRKENVDFFPLIKIKLNSTEQPKGFNRVIYPSSRINTLVINIKDEKIRKILSNCIDPQVFLKLPYFEYMITPYHSIIPQGLENYIPTKKNIKFNIKSCKKIIASNKYKIKLRWLNIYSEPDDVKFIKEIASHINEKVNTISFEIMTKSIADGQKVLAEGDFEIFLGGVSSPYPLAEGILTDFIYSQTDKNKLIKFEIPQLKKIFNIYQFSEETQKRNEVINKMVNYIIDEGWVIPIGRRIDTFLIPEKWKNISMVNGMNGNFYLGGLNVE
jgi:peptide/nickel transport system substrate-binding protein